MAAVASVASAFPNLDGVNSRTCLEGCSRTPLHPVLFHFLPLYPTISANQSGFDPFFPSTPLLFVGTWNLVSFNPLLLSTRNFKPRNLYAQSPPLSLSLSLISLFLSPLLSRSPCLHLSSLQHRLSYGDNMLISHSQC